MLTLVKGRNDILLALGCFLIAIVLPFLTINNGLLVPILALLSGSLLIFIMMVFKSPFIGLITTVAYSFSYILVSRISGIDFPFGYGVEALYFLLLIVMVCRLKSDQWARVVNDLTLLFVIWFLISILQFFNVSGASWRGWVHEIRTSGLDSILLVILGFLIFRKNKHVDVFLFVIIIFSLFATLNGITQIHIGLTRPEQIFLDQNPTHNIWGKIRAFSFYRDAGQFGASQAQFSVVCGILAMGSFKLWKRILFAVLALFFLYGMLISGTRGSFFALVPGIFLGIFLFKNMKVLFSGLILMLCFLAFLKFTHIGSGNYHIYRFRTALNPEDASLNVRFNSQQLLGEYLKDRPFGEGLGVIGYAGHEYNSDKFLSTIEPDSYWVKVWAMYGIVGFIYWFCMMMYITGKSCGIIWRIEDKKLKVKLIALTSGFFGIFISSYGNEVINALPSSIVCYLSMVLVFMGPRFDRKLKIND